MLGGREGAWMERWRGGRLIECVVAERLLGGGARAPLAGVWEAGGREGLRRVYNNLPWLSRYRLRVQ